MAKAAGAKKKKPAPASMASSAAVATLAVKDLKTARKFYEQTLGFRLVQAMGEEAVTYESGGSQFFVYKSEYAGTNRATAATWMVENVDGIVEDLKAHGVAFEHYNLPEMTRKGDVHGDGHMRAAWFKDPDGNILALVSG